MSGGGAMRVCWGWAGTGARCGPGPRGAARHRGGTLRGFEWGISAREGRTLAGEGWTLAGEWATVADEGGSVAREGEMLAGEERTLAGEGRRPAAG